MTSDVVPSAFPAKYPELGSGRVGFASADFVRVVRPTTGGVLLSALFALCCASGPQAAQTSPPPAKGTQAGAVGGGPQQSYDVFGKRYNIRPSSDGYRERGVASWYGHPFDGRPTSSGEMYDMNEMTAAHPTLPIPTWVQVTNLKNGKHVTVKINDRGPFVGKRLIDLSYAAATELDMVQKGTTKVEVRALPGPPTSHPATAERRDNLNPSTTHDPGKTATPVNAPAAPAKSRPASPPPATQPPPPREKPERLFAEAGRFTNRDDAVHLVNELKSQGLVNAFVVSEDNRRRTLHRVRVGPLLDTAEVERMNDRLRELGGRRSHEVAMR